MDGRQIKTVAAFTTLFLLGLEFMTTGLRNATGLVERTTAASNYPGTLLATPAWCLMLPFAVIALWRRQQYGTLCIVAGIAGAAGTLTMPCAWERANWAGLVGSTLMSLVFAFSAWWLKRNERS